MFLSSIEIYFTLYRVRLTRVPSDDDKLLSVLIERAKALEGNF
jgi:hypothetical protein